MYTYLLLILISASLSGPAWAAKDPTAHWRCLQSAPSEIPVEAELTLPEIEKLITTAKKYPAVDFFYCFDKALNGFNEVFEALGEAYRVRNIVSGYAAEAYRAGAMTPFEPGTQSGKDYLKQVRKMMEDLRKGKRVPQSEGLAVPDEYMLDEACLDELFKGGKAENPGFERELLRMLDRATMSEAQCTKFKQACERRKANIAKVIEKYLPHLLPKKSVASSSTESGTASCPDPGIADVNAILENSKIASYLGDCINLKEGENKNIVSRVTTVTSTYKLTRLKDDAGKPRYQVALPYQFVGDPPELGDQVKKRTQECFERVADKVRGPDGEKLELKINDEFPSRNPIQVNVSAKIGRSNTLNWNSAEDCPTILHETLHHLGLVDEYREMSMGFRLKADGGTEFVNDKATHLYADCRVPGPPDSIMETPILALGKTQQKIIYSVCACFFPGAQQGGGFGPGFADSIEEGSERFKEFQARDSDKCLEKLIKLPKDAEKCPDGVVSFEVYHQYFSQNVENEKRYLAAMEAGGLASSINTVQKNIKTTSIPPEKSTLLYPAHFRAIISPDCLSENKIYYSCARESQKTSIGNLGDDRCSKTLPPECTKGGAAWLQ
ncbi:MAG TPA: hypothetical protein DCS07_09000 [Bdellovibrionales bacterium]|nr:MAG: hypothetical protein A2Z97_10875 [Bdellovibrionales bacterium GWB1_52_6]OFZ03538.1 MAG: hypothetical protein A2X97_06215 [Bdellovibrionales bacterium GWA1_52_35]OFZ43756.1 MAG: hypothetical protein A2070_07380 [Bdellovibrionales bacterium GWC1_52_8]HAR42748.1 hypothetical protein [Bdellovibrionales bacterium]HCM41124.1 hypothetical protein [Bdellovibrionales bacterium]